MHHRERRRINRRRGHDLAFCREVEEYVSTAVDISERRLENTSRRQKLIGLRLDWRKNNRRFRANYSILGVLPEQFQVSRHLMMSRIFHSPVFVAAIYIALVPAYGLVYYLTPRFWQSPLSFIESHYFSIVTITTLGYGEIIPQTETARIVTASEAILGVLVIGLFLNAVAHRANEAKENRRKEAIKTHLLAQYHQWREDLCSAALRCAVGGYGVEFGTAERLSKYEEFRKAFAGNSRDKFYDVINGIQDNPQFLRDIFTISGLFGQQINAAIGAAQSENTKSIAVLTRVSQHPHLLQSLDVYLADPAKYVGQYLFEVLAMWSNSDGYLEIDFIEHAIDSM